MPHDTDLIGTIAVSLLAALAGGMIAARLKLPTIVGYLVAGIAVGPFTPGYVADQAIATQLAEIGVVLLMFGVGMHFSIPDLLAVRGIAIPGAIAQIAVATGLGMGVARFWGWDLGEGLVFGLALSVASTIVLLRALEERGWLFDEPGRTAVGWLLVEDIFTVVVVVMLPGLAGFLGGVSPEGQGSILWDLTSTLGKMVAFVALMLVLGRRLIPKILDWTEQVGARDLFVLAVLAIALGIAFAAAEFFAVSVALGAFLAGIAVAESDVSHRAAEHALPLQEAFAVLFFVSVGMLLDPSVLIQHWERVVIVTLIVVVGKSVAALALTTALGRPVRTGLTVAAGLAQVGEFSFILAELGHSLELISDDAHYLILAAAFVSITINPFVMRGIDPTLKWIGSRPRLQVMVNGWRSAPTRGTPPEPEPERETV